jgi:hypothetical protein
MYASKHAPWFYACHKHPGEALHQELLFFLGTFNLLPFVYYRNRN